MEVDPVWLWCLISSELAARDSAMDRSLFARVLGVVIKCVEDGSALLHNFKMEGDCRNTLITIEFHGYPHHCETPPEPRSPGSPHKWPSPPPSAGSSGSSGERNLQPPSSSGSLGSLVGGDVTHHQLAMEGQQLPAPQSAGCRAESRVIRDSQSMSVVGEVHQSAASSDVSSSAAWRSSDTLDTEPEGDVRAMWAQGDTRVKRILGAAHDPDHPCAVHGAPAAAALGASGRPDKQSPSPSMPALGALQDAESALGGRPALRRTVSLPVDMAGPPPAKPRKASKLVQQPSLPDIEECPDGESCARQREDTGVAAPVPAVAPAPAPAAPGRGGRDGRQGEDAMADLAGDIKGEATVDIDSGISDAAAAPTLDMTDNAVRYPPVPTEVNSTAANHPPPAIATLGGRHAVTLSPGRGPIVPGAGGSDQARQGHIVTTHTHPTDIPTGASAATTHVDRIVGVTTITASVDQTTVGFTPITASKNETNFGFTPITASAHETEVGFTPTTASVAPTKVGFTPTAASTGRPTVGSTSVYPTKVGFTPVTAPVDPTKLGFTPVTASVDATKVGFTPITASADRSRVGFTPIAGCAGPASVQAATTTAGAGQAVTGQVTSSPPPDALHRFRPAPPPRQSSLVKPPPAPGVTPQEPFATLSVNAKRQSFGRSKSMGVDDGESGQPQRLDRAAHECAQSATELAPPGGRDVSPGSVAAAETGTTTTVIRPEPDTTGPLHVAPPSGHPSIRPIPVEPPVVPPVGSAREPEAEEDEGITFDTNQNTVRRKTKTDFKQFFRRGLRRSTTDPKSLADKATKDSSAKPPAEKAAKDSSAKSPAEKSKLNGSAKGHAASKDRAKSPPAASEAASASGTSPPPAGAGVGATGGVTRPPVAFPYYYRKAKSSASGGVTPPASPGPSPTHSSGEEDKDSWDSDDSAELVSDVRKLRQAKTKRRHLVQL